MGPGYLDRKEGASTLARASLGASNGNCRVHKQANLEFVETPGRASKNPRNWCVMGPTWLPALAKGTYGCSMLRPYNAVARFVCAPTRERNESSGANMLHIYAIIQ